MELSQDPHLVVLGIKVNSWAWGIEQAKRLIELGESVTILDLGKNYGSKRKNLRNEFQNRIIQSLECEYLDWNELISHSEKKNIYNQARKCLRELRKIEDWQNYKYDGIPLGRIIMSNYARTAGTKNFSLQLVSKGLQQKIATQTLIALAAYERVKERFDKVSVSNGRSPIEAGVLFGARRDLKKTYVLERGSSTKEWHIWKTSCHYSPDWWELLQESASIEQTDTMSKIAEKYWNQRLSGWDILSNRDWSIEFDKGNLPANLPEEFVTFFCTSEHESPALPEFECSHLGFSSQQVAVQTLARICQQSNRMLVIKRHPNSLATDGTDRELPNWSWALELPHVVYVGPKSRVDTYDLIAKSSAVITFKSSVGIEAAAMGIPSRAMGPAEWAFTNESRIWNEQEVMTFIVDPTQLAKSTHVAWGYLTSTFGMPLTIFKDVTGGFAVTESEKFYSSENYVKSHLKLIEKIVRRFWSIKMSLAK